MAVQLKVTNKKGKTYNVEIPQEVLDNASTALSVWFNNQTEEGYKELVTSLTRWNDDAHKEDHILEVLGRAELMAKSILDRPLYTEEKLAIAFHDCGCCIERDTHEQIGAYILMEALNLNRGILNAVDRFIAVDAVASHRGSYKGELMTEAAELLSSADRGNPNHLEGIMDRSLKYNLKFGADVLASIENAKEHIKGKYGRNGSTRYPSIYMEYYKDAMEKFWDEIDALSNEDFERLL